MFEFKLPDLGEGISEGEIVKWHVSKGDSIEEDAPLVDVETDKAAVTIPSPRAGTIASTTGAPGETVQVGDVIAVIEVDGEAVPSDRRGAPAASSTGKPSREPGRPVPAAPATRKLAREIGVDIDALTGSGPAGRVTDDDVRGAAGAEKPESGRPPEDRPGDESPSGKDSEGAPGAGLPFLDLGPLPDFGAFGPVTREPLRSVRRKTARRMVTSFTLVPHVAHMDEADITDLEAFRKSGKGRASGEGEKGITLLAFVIRAVARGLREHPIFNASLDHVAEEIVLKEYVNVGIAVDTPRGLIVPVIRGPGDKSLVELSGEVADLAARGHDGTIEASELQGGTFTITNPGPLGGTAFIPIINHPESAILGMGRVHEKALVRDGRIEARKVLPLVLAFDHRLADGMEAARFMHDLVRRLEDPDALFLET